MKLLRFVVALAASVALSPFAQAQDWPRQPIKLVVGFAPGGAADQLARLIAVPLKDALGQTVVVENKAGAGGNLGGDLVAKSAADGYTLLMASGGMVSSNPHLYPKMPFDPAKDLVPVAALARVPFYLVVRTDSTAAGFKDLVADLKAHPGQRSYGSPGNGSAPHLAAELMASQTGTTAIHIPYRGAAPALTDLLAGQINFLFDPGNSIPHVKAGKLRMLAVGSSRRSPQMPDVPTLDELGLKGFDADAVFGLYAPAGTPPAIVQRLNAVVNQALKTAPMIDSILAIGSVPEPLSAADFGRKGAADFERLGKLIRERNIKPD